MRRGVLDPATCGLSSDGLHGAWFVAGNVVRDLAALNKHEMLAWEVWGIMHEWGGDRPIPEAVSACLDTVAATERSSRQPGRGVAPTDTRSIIRDTRAWGQ